MIDTRAGPGLVSGTAISAQNFLWPPMPQWIFWHRRLQYDTRLQLAHSFLALRFPHSVLAQSLPTDSIPSFFLPPPPSVATSVAAVAAPRPGAAPLVLLAVEGPVGQAPPIPPPSPAVAAIIR